MPAGSYSLPGSGKGRSTGTGAVVRPRSSDFPLRRISRTSILDRFGGTAFRSSCRTARGPTGVGPSILVTPASRWSHPPIPTARPSGTSSVRSGRVRGACVSTIRKPGRPDAYRSRPSLRISLRNNGSSDRRHPPLCRGLQTPAARRWVPRPESPDPVSGRARMEARRSLRWRASMDATLRGRSARASSLVIMPVPLSSGFFASQATPYRGRWPRIGCGRAPLFMIRLGGSPWPVSRWVRAGPRWLAAPRSSHRPSIGTRSAYATNMARWLCEGYRMTRRGNCWRPRGMSPVSPRSHPSRYGPSSGSDSPIRCPRRKCRRPTRSSPSFSPRSRTSRCATASPACVRTLPISPTG